MEIDVVKSRIDSQVVELSNIAKLITALDSNIELEVNPENAVIFAEVIIRKGNEFEDLVQELKLNLDIYMQLLSSLNLPIPMSYVKLQRRVNHHT